ncbi:unnamed protein product, partial [Musa banksii]
PVPTLLRFDRSSSDLGGRIDAANDGFRRHRSLEPFVSKTYEMVDDDPSTNPTRLMGPGEQRRRHNNFSLRLAVQKMLTVLIETSIVGWKHSHG